MAIRHVKRRYSNRSDSSSDSSSEDEKEVKRVDLSNEDGNELLKNHPYIEKSQAEISNDNSKSHNKLNIQNNGEDEDEDSDSESDSDEEEELKFHRPVLVKKNTDQEKESQLQTIEEKKYANVLKRVEHENSVFKWRKETSLQIETNYSTDKDVLRRVMNLDDNDIVNPEYEKQEWLNRQNVRKQRYRDILIAKQLEMEEYQANKLLGENNDLEKESEVLNSIENKQQLPNNPRRPKSKYINKKNRYKPNRSETVNFGSLDVANNNSKEEQETEYSII